MTALEQSSRDHPNPLIRRLGSYYPLSSEEIRILNDASTREVAVPADRDLVREGDRPTDSNLLVKGITFRYRLLNNGSRQILSFHVPGDIYDSQSFLLEEMDHNVATLTPCTIAVIPHATIVHFTEHQPRLARAIWKAAAVDAAITREWMVSLGRRSAREALAHLLCELLTRLSAVGLAHNHSAELPLTQTEIGDALGLSSVHVNRTITALRQDGLITMARQHLVIRDWARLQKLAQFNPRYLHAHQDGTPFGQARAGE